MIVPDDAPAAVSCRPQKVELGLRIDGEHSARIVGGIGSGAYRGNNDLILALANQEPAAFQWVGRDGRTPQLLGIAFADSQPDWVGIRHRSILR